MSKWKRKVQKTGSETLGVNLPKPWIRHYGIQSGVVLELVTQDGKIEISPEGEK